MATFDTLANETLIHIMEMLRDPPPRLWDNPNASVGRYDALRAAALVCSRWRDPAQQALFEEVEISEEYTLRAGRFSASPARLRLRTRSLFVGSGALDWLEISEACERLQSVDLFCVDNFSPNVLARRCFAGLKNLKIAAGWLPVEGLDPGLHLPTGLTSLTLWTTFDQPAMAFLSAITSSSIRTLDTLHLRIPQGVPGEGLSLAFRVVGPNLRSFILDTSYTYLERNLDIFQTLTALGIFSWNNSSGTQFRGTDLNELPSILDAFPSPATLHHFSIATDDFTILGLVIILLENPALALLTKLEFPFLSPTPPLPPIADELREACESRGIRLILGPGQ